jgi:hypothetical protein
MPQLQASGETNSVTISMLLRQRAFVKDLVRMNTVVAVRVRQGVFVQEGDALPVLLGLAPLVDLLTVDKAADLNGLG